MGDEILKKYLMIAASVVSLYAMPQIGEDPNLQKDLKRFDSLFEEISKKRKGINKAVINALKDPFVYKKEIKRIVQTKNGKVIKTTPKKRVLKLLAIFNNKAKINGKWYRVNQKIDNYKLLKIRKNSVILRDGGRRITLYLRKRDDKIKITVH